MESYLDIKKFKLLNKIGDGGYSSVYKIQNKKTGQFFAAKIFRDDIDKNNIKNLIREVNIFSHISHPSANKYFGYSLKDFNDENRLVIVSEYIENGSLEQVFELEKNNKSPSNWNDTKKLINIFGIASAMRYLHSKCIVHRDLKPSNILEDHNFYPKICDFGSSRYQGNDLYSLTNMVPLYTAPEFFDDENTYSLLCDVYSFGMITYFIMAGCHPKFKAKSAIQYITQILRGYRPNIDSKVPKSYKDLIEQCWVGEPSQRPSFEQIVFMLKNDPGFLTESVDKDEFKQYVEYIEKNEKEEEEKNSNINNNDKYSIEEDYINDDDDDEKNKSDPFVLNATKINIKSFIKKEKLGSGFCGNVYKVINDSTKKFYAAKVMKDVFYADDKNTNKGINLIREVSILSQLLHPSIMKFYGYSSTDFIDICRPVIITEYVKNGTLEDIIEIERNGIKLSFWDDTMKLINIYGIAKSMKYLHSKNILHRDLKPGNVLVDIYLFPKLADFGFSKSLKIDSQKDQDIQNRTHSNVMGTDGFIAPEIWSDSNYTKAGDVYAFAMLVYEVLTTKFPFYGKNDCQIMYSVSVKNDRPKLNKEIPKHYKDLIVECWQKDPNKRPSFESIVTKLETDTNFITEKIDKNRYFNYIQFINNSIKNKNTDMLFEKYSLEPIYNEYKENRSILIEQGFINIDDFEKLSEINSNDFSKFYCISDKISGQLYLAETSKFDVSNLTSNEKENLMHEVEILSTLKHQTIQKIVGYSMFNFKHHPKPVIVKEYFDNNNRTLFDVIENERNDKKEEKWTQTQKLINIFGIASGMSYLHSKDILHHELRTKKIFVDENLMPKISEFGFYIKPQNSRKVLSESMHSNKEIQYFLSPEVLQSKQPSKASDVYSFAFIVYEIMSSEIPFHDFKDQNQIIVNVVNKCHRPFLTNKIPPVYKKLISSCWEQNPNLRPSFDTIVNELKTNDEFITEKVDKAKFLKYVESINK